MLHQKYTAAPHQQLGQAHNAVETTEKQHKLAQLCLDWRLSVPQYKYTRRGSNNVVVGLHCSVIVGEVEYSSPLAGTDWHPGWGTHNDAREAVAGEVLRALGVEAEEEYEEPQPPRRRSQHYSGGEIFTSPSAFDTPARPSRSLTDPSETRILPCLYYNT